MLASLIQHSSPINKAIKASHIAVIIPRLERIPSKYEIPGEEVLKHFPLKHLAYTRPKKDDP